MVILTVLSIYTDQGLPLVFPNENDSHLLTWLCFITSCMKETEAPFHGVLILLRIIRILPSRCLPSTRVYPYRQSALGLLVVARSIFKELNSMVGLYPSLCAH